MTTIITRHYPASKLPAELREGIDPSSLVTVTIIQRLNPDTISEPRQLADRTEKEVSVNLRSRRDERDE
jgi:hypothetical protein